MIKNNNAGYKLSGSIQQKLILFLNMERIFGINWDKLSCAYLFELSH
jgi:hypothetical protein